MNLLFKNKPKLDMSNYPHINAELYNAPVGINEELLYELESNLSNAAMRGEANGDYIMDNVPSPYTYGDIGVIPVKGILCSSATPDEMSCGLIGLDMIRGWYNEALNDNNMRGILFDVNCGGGSIAGVESFANYIAENRNVKSTVVFVNGLLGSAAYWCMSSLPINITLGSDVGGIGVSCVIKDTFKHYEDQGIKVYQFKSSPLKGQNQDGVEILPAYRAAMDKKVLSIGTKFNNHVLKYRQIKDTEAALSGLSYLDNEAIGIGLADNLVENIDDLLNTFGD